MKPELPILFFLEPSGVHECGPIRVCDFFAPYALEGKTKQRIAVADTGR